MHTSAPPLPWLEAGAPFPDPRSAWGAASEAPGLLAAGADLSVATLRSAYSKGIFPWFSPGQPILWWSTDPRMVLHCHQFRIHPSFRKTLLRFINNTHCEIRIDTAFAQVIQQCATRPRATQNGTWIVPAMVEAYTALHHAGHAHSIETWIDGQLVGGLYCVALGRAVFGESMFSAVPNASKIALAGLTALCIEHEVALIDCQQSTSHLRSLGAQELSRAQFIAHISVAQTAPAFHWRFSPLYWKHLLANHCPSS